jgi:hypothetical protein
MPKLLPALVLAFALSAAPACRSWFFGEQWYDMGTEYDVDFSIVWDAVRLTLIDEFKTLEYERSAEGVLVTGWDEQLSYLAGEGFREQAHIRVEKGEKGYRVLVRVKRDVNEEPIYTLESRNARWRPTEDNAARAQHLVGLIHIKLKAVTDS